MSNSTAVGLTATASVPSAAAGTQRALPEANVREPSAVVADPGRRTNATRAAATSRASTFEEYVRTPQYQTNHEEREAPTAMAPEPDPNMASASFQRQTSVNEATPACINLGA